VPSPTTAGGLLAGHYDSADRPLRISGRQRHRNVVRGPGGWKEMDRRREPMETVTHAVDCQ